MKGSSLALAAAVVTALVSCSDGDSFAPDDPAGTAAATRLLTISPQGGATGVARDGRLTVVFDGAMMAGMEQYVDLHRGDVTGPTHPIACTWSADRTQLTCTPATPLDPGTGYTVHVGGGLRNADGNQILMDPTLHGGSWIHGTAPEGGMMGAGMNHWGDHAGHSWETMGSGWQDANGSYGISCPFVTG